MFARNSLFARLAAAALSVASISASDEAIGLLIADAFDKIGPNGVTTIEEGHALVTEVEVVEGMQFDRGYVSAHFVTDQQAIHGTRTLHVALHVGRSRALVGSILEQK